MSDIRFTPAPDWPDPAPGWLPPAGWQPPADWPKAPDGWVFYRGGYGEPVEPPAGSWRPPIVVAEQAAGPAGRGLGRGWLVPAVTGGIALVVGIAFGALVVPQFGAVPAPAVVTASPVPKTPSECLDALRAAEGLERVARSGFEAAVDGMSSFVDGDYVAANAYLDELGDFVDDLSSASDNFSESAQGCRAHS